jgi:hypothetical protein
MSKGISISFNQEGQAMYYIVCGGTIVESQFSEPAQEELQGWADTYREHVYVISGEHYGMTAEWQGEHLGGEPVKPAASQEGEQ